MLGLGARCTAAGVIHPGGVDLAHHPGHVSFMFVILEHPVNGLSGSNSPAS
jgi:hypothetical protein